MRFARHPLSRALAAVSFAFTLPAAWAVPLDIPVQSLDAALTRFAEQADVRLLYSAELTRGLNSRAALKGDYPTLQGLQQLLEGSGLGFQVGGDGTYTLVRLPGSDDALTLGSTSIVGSAPVDERLPEVYAGGQVARGARMGVLGNQDMQDVPFSFTSYTRELVENRQAQTLGEVLRSDPAVRQSYGFGNFSQVFVIRGFALNSDDVAFNGLYGIAPRQIISTESVERVEVFKGASAFLTGVSPTGSGIGGAINVVSKHAGDTPTRSVTLDYASDGRVGGHVDLGQRFGEDNRFGVRVNLATRNGESAVEREHSHFSLAAVGLDYRDDRLRLSTDFGYQRQRLNEGRSPVYLTTTGSTSTLNGRIPHAPDASHNYAQPWSWSQLEDSFGMFNAEYDLAEHWTAYLAAGGKYTRENGVYSSLYVSGLDGTATLGRLYTPRDEDSRSVDGGLRGRLATGPVSHQLNLGLSGNWREYRSANEFTGPAGRPGNNLYDPWPVAEPAPTSISGDLHDPGKTGSSRNRSAALSDTLGFLDDRVLLTLGVRRQAISTDAWSAATGLRTSKYDDHIVTPVYGLVVKPSESLSLYANRIEGLQPGQVSTAAGNLNEVFPPYRTKQIEAGIKLDRGHYGAQLGVFRIEQPQLVTQLVNGTNYSSVDGEQVNRGVELNLFGEPVAGLRLMAGGTLMDAELRKTASGANDGNRATGVARFQYNLSADWDVPGVKGLAVDALLMRTGGQYLDAANELQTRPWTRVDLGARYVLALDEKKVTLRAGLENVADKDYWESASTTGAYLTQGAPRTLKVSATLDF